MARKRTRRLFGVGAWCLLVSIAIPAQVPEVIKQRCEGVVLDALARPVPAAEVWVANEDESVVMRGKSDGAGSFVLGGLPNATYWRVRATAPGRIEVRTWVRPREGVGTASFRLWDAATLVGRVCDVDGTAIAGAEVAAAFDLSRVISPLEIPTAITDADGRFRLDKVPVGVLDVWAAADGFVASAQRLHFAADGECELRLARGEGLSIQVDVEGARELIARGVAAPQVRVRPYGSSGLVGLPPRLVRGRLDAEGRWQVRGLPKFRYVVSPSATDLGFQPREIDVFGQHGGVTLAAFHAPTEGKVGRAAFRAFRNESVVLTGRVIDEHGDGVVGETLVTRAANGGNEATAVTGEEGAFAIASPLAPGVEAVFFLRDSQRVPDQLLDDAPFFDARNLRWHRAKVDPQRPLLIKTIRVSRIRGRVVDSEGASVSFARVEVQESAPNRLPPWLTLWPTDSRVDGTFEFAIHAMDEPMRIAITSSAGAVMSKEFVTRPGSFTDVGELKLAPAASVAGVVRDANQKPVPGARVWLRDWDSEAGRQKSGSVVEVITDRAGRFRFAGVPPGGAWLQLMLYEENPRVHGFEPFEVSPGAALTFDLVLTER